MFTPGKIIYFNPLEFPDGSSKPKYMLVLKVHLGNVILVSLPSSIFHLPANMQTNHGCLEIPDSSICCYIFKANVVITSGGWSFPLDTFLYGWWIDEYNVTELSNKYTIPNVDYEIIGDLTPTELQNVIKCFVASSVVKKKYRRLLGGN